jgi:hypothetical protein
VSPQIEFSRKESVLVQTLDRAVMLAKARAARGQTKKEEVSVRDDSLDMKYWEQLASDFGVRLPKRGQVVTTGNLTRWLRKIDIPVAAYCIWTGSRTLKDAVELTKGYGLRFIGAIALEHRERILRCQ